MGKNKISYNSLIGDIKTIANQAVIIFKKQNMKITVKIKDVVIKIDDCNPQTIVKYHANEIITIIQSATTNCLELFIKQKEK